MEPITLKLRVDHAKKGKDQQRRRPPPIEVSKEVPKLDACQSRYALSPHGHSGVKTQTVFPYHIDEENKIIYKMADDGTWTQGVPKRAQGEYLGKLVRWAEVPQTLEFNYDWVMTKIAFNTQNFDLQRILNRLMFIRQAHDIRQFPTHLAPVTGFDASEGPLPPYGAGAILNSDGSYASLVDWDYFLCDIKNASHLMAARRRWNMQGVKKVASWCVWGRNQTIENRTEFVEDDEGGYAIEKSLWTQNGSPTRLGYRRDQECDWGNVTGPWDPETRTDHDKAVTAWWEHCAGDGVKTPWQ